VPEFERLTRHTAVISYDAPNSIRERVLAGEKFDLTLLPDGWDEIRAKLASTPLAVGHTEFGMAVAATASKPDTGSIDALKRTLLVSRSIVYTEPKTGAIAGVLFARMIERLGIADEIKKKSRRISDALNARLIKTGEADLAALLSSEVLAVPGVQFLAMPPEFRATVTFSGAVAKEAAAEPEIARSLLQFFTGPSAVSMLKSNGFEPG